MVNPKLTIHSLTKITPAKKTRKLGLTCVGNANVVLMIDNVVINLCGKILSKLIHCFLIMLIKVLSISINMLYFLKIQSMRIPGIFRTKSTLLNMFDLIKTTLCITVNDNLGLDTVPSPLCR